MKQPPLIDVEPTHPTRKERLEEFKREHHIWTFYSRQCEPPWTALMLPGNPHRPLPYGNEMDPTDPILIIARYCTALDDAGFLTTGTTEREAINQLCQNLKI